MSNNYIYPGLNQAGQVSGAVQQGKKISAPEDNGATVVEQVASTSAGTSQDLLASLNFIAGQNKVAVQSTVQTATQKEISSLQTNIQNAQSQVNTLSPQVAKLKSNLDKLRAALKKTKLVKKGKKTVKVYVYSSGKRKEMNEQLEKTKKQLKSREVKISDLERKIDSWQVRLDTLQPPANEPEESNTPEIPGDTTTPPVTPDEPTEEIPTNPPGDIGVIDPGDDVPPGEDTPDVDFPEFSIEDLLGKDLSKINDALNSTSDSYDKEIPFQAELLSALNKTRWSGGSVEILSVLSQSFGINPETVVGYLNQWGDRPGLWSPTYWAQLPQNIVDGLTAMGYIPKIQPKMDLSQFSVQDTLVNQFGISTDTLNQLIQTYGVEPQKWALNVWENLDPTIQGALQMVGMMAAPVITPLTNTYTALTGVYNTFGPQLFAPSMLADSSIESLFKNNKALVDKLIDLFGLPPDTYEKAFRTPKTNEDYSIIQKAKSDLGGAYLKTARQLNTFMSGMMGDATNWASLTRVYGNDIRQWGVATLDDYYQSPLYSKNLPPVWIKKPDEQTMMGTLVGAYNPNLPEKLYDADFIKSFSEELGLKPTYKLPPEILKALGISEWSQISPNVADAALVFANMSNLLQAEQNARAIKNASQSYFTPSYPTTYDGPKGLGPLSGGTYPFTYSESLVKLFQTAAEADPDFMDTVIAKIRSIDGEVRSASGEDLISLDAALADPFAPVFQKYTDKQGGLYVGGNLMPGNPYSTLLYGMVAQTYMESLDRSKGGNEQLKATLDSIPQLFGALDNTFYLVNTGLIGIDLSGAVIDNAAIGGSFIASAYDAPFSDFSRAQLTNVMFDNADYSTLENVTTDGLLLLTGSAKKTDLEGSSHKETLVLKACIAEGLSAKNMNVNILDVTGSNLQNASFEGSRIKYLDLTKRDSMAMNNIKYGYSELSGLKDPYKGLSLKNTVVGYAVFNDVDLSMADLSGMEISGGTYTTSTKFPPGFDPAAHNLDLIVDSYDPLDVVLNELPMDTQIKLVSKMLSAVGLLPNPDYTSRSSEEPFIDPATYYQKRLGALQESVTNEFSAISQYYSPAKQDAFLDIQWECMDAAAQKVWGVPAGAVMDPKLRILNREYRNQDPSKIAEFEYELKNALANYQSVNAGQDWFAATQPLNMSWVNEAWNYVNGQISANAIAEVKKQYAAQGLTYNENYDYQLMQLLNYDQPGIAEGAQLRAYLSVMQKLSNDWNYTSQLLTAYQSKQQSTELKNVASLAQDPLTEAELQAGVFQLLMTNSTGSKRDRLLQMAEGVLLPGAQSTSPFLDNGKITRQLSELWNNEMNYTSGLTSKYTVFQEVMQEDMGQFAQQLETLQTQMMMIYKNRTEADTPAYQAVTRQIDDIRQKLILLNSSADGFMQSLGDPFSGNDGPSTMYLALKRYAYAEPTPTVPAEGKWLQKIGKSVAEYAHIPYSTYGNIAEDIGTGVLNQLASIPEAVWNNPGYTAMAAAVLVPAAVFAPIVTLSTLAVVGVLGTAAQGAVAGSNLYEGYTKNNHQLIQQGWQGVGATLVDAALTAVDGIELSSAARTLKSWQLTNQLPGTNNTSHSWNSLTRNYKSVKESVDKAWTQQNKTPSTNFETAAQTIADIPLTSQIGQSTGLAEAARLRQVMENITVPASLARTQAEQLSKGGKVTGPLADDFLIPAGASPQGMEFGYANIVKGALEYGYHFVLLSEDSPEVAKALKWVDGVEDSVTTGLKNGTLPMPAAGMSLEDATQLQEAAALINYIRDGINGADGLLGKYNQAAFDTVSTEKQLGATFLQQGLPVPMDTLISEGTGICRHTAALFKKMADKLRLEVSLVYGKAHAWCEMTLPGGARCIIETTDGSIYIQTNKGVGVFNMKNPQTNTRNPKIFSSGSFQNFLNTKFAKGGLYDDVFGLPTYSLSGEWF